MTQQDLETRLIDLETRLAHYDRTLSDMSDMIKSQWDRIDVLERRNYAMGEDIKRMGNYFQTAPEDEAPPPHY
ncbi:SlyX family protein [Thalassospira sp.]|uniref:SlyX family protein n=1 Tax=Thalassospira sp. TaxID=1912094 RepID=UPI00273346FD|nr:SlyX family protein [Thalassospira sp.]MDP2698734.1 SlyX family protein [Thalassospira sp.]